MKCLTNLYRKAEAVKREKAEPSNQAENLEESLVFAELVCFVEEELSNPAAPVLKLADLVKIYCARLQQLGIQTKVHSTRLKERLEAHIPGLQDYAKGRDVFLVRGKDIGRLLGNFFEKQNDSSAICLAQAAKIVRNEVFCNPSKFDGSFKPDCQEDSLPPALKALVRMLIEGPNIVLQAASPIRQEVLTIAHLIKFNCVKHKRSPTAAVLNEIRHQRQQETPLPLYIGLMIYGQTRKRGLIEKLFQLGICASYDKVLRVSTELSNAICDRFHNENVVVPSNFSSGVFTSAAVDNIDHNPSSTTSTGSFHGTGISLFQHPDFEGQGIRLEAALVNECSSKVVKPLPEFYAYVPPSSTTQRNVKIPSVPDHTLLCTQVSDADIIDQYCWLRKVNDVIMKEDKDEENTSWSAFHASIKPLDKNTPKCQTSLLPLFEDAAHSVAMIRHSMSLVQRSVEYLNPGQIPVLACDQPLFATAKNIQWTWPNQFGEDKFLVLMGGLHVEMAAWNAIGTWLEDSGWTDIITQADVSSAGKAESFLHSSHVTRTRYAHEVTVASLYVLQRQAHMAYQIACQEEGKVVKSFDDWCLDKAAAHPQFKYWHLVMKLELIVLAFVQSLRSSDFTMYFDALVRLVPWFFALDRPNYSRWLSVHIRDMQSLPSTHPAVVEQFKAGKFTFRKSCRSFSALPLDQTHEQNNKIIKGDGGAIGLTENPQALRRWMIGGPEIANLVKQFEDTVFKDSTTQCSHHEQVTGKQNRFQKHVKQVVEKFAEVGSPFMDDSTELISMVSKSIADESVIKSTYEIEDLGREKYHDFVQKRFIDRSVAIDDPIPQNKLAKFKDRKKKLCPKNSTLKLRSAKLDCQLFSRLYIGCQNRDGSLSEFFAHENQACPPSISDCGKLRQTAKAPLVSCLESFCEATPNEPEVTVVVLDGAAVVHFNPPGSSKTFGEYGENVIAKYVKRWLIKVSRVDLVWDSYIENSLKSSTREKRGSGARNRVLPFVQIPRKWNEFLRVDKNKVELFSMLSKIVVEVDVNGKDVFATDGENVLCSSKSQNVDQLSPCSHEEADTRIIIHCLDAARKGHQKLMIRTVDTDVVIIAICYYHLLNVEELWIALVLAPNFAICQHTDMRWLLERRRLDHCCFCMPFRDVTRYLSSLDVAKRQRGMSGCHLMRAMRRFWHFSMIHRSSLMNALPCWKDLLSFSMTEQVIKMRYVETLITKSGLPLFLARVTCNISIQGKRFSKSGAQFISMLIGKCVSISFFPLRLLL